jgi:6-phosphogluconate dehydrogenase
MQSRDVGLIGLGVMGENLALNLERNGFSVCGYDHLAAKRKQFELRTLNLQACTAASLSELVQRLRRPRRVLIMVPAGGAVDAVLQTLAPLLQAGDVVMDGGNSHYSDTNLRLQVLRESGIHFIGLGVSGGERGALWGPALMPGGDPAGWPLVQPMLQAIAARADQGHVCCEWMGPEGAGHYVKMVHNGIEYADMQILCEAYWMMHQVLEMPAQEIGKVFAQWSDGELSSYLLDISAEILQHKDPDNGRALVELILDTAEQKGTGKWASQAALDLGVSAPTITQAVHARAASALKQERILAASVLKGVQGGPRVDQHDMLQKIHNAVLASRVCATAQGFALLGAASREFDWRLPLATIASVWQAGCILRARLLRPISQAFAQQPDLHNLLIDPQCAGLLAHSQQELREVVALAALHGTPVPALMSALSYYDAYRSARLPANLLQAQRDYFGAHGYQRIDKPGKFHTRWQN